MHGTENLQDVRTGTGERLSVVTLSCKVCTKMFTRMSQSLWFGSCSW